MKETRTVEQYIVKRLNKLEGQIEACEQDKDWYSRRLEMANKDIQRLESDLKFLANIFTQKVYEKDGTSEYYYESKSIWEKPHEEVYGRLKKIVNCWSGPELPF